MPRSIDSDVLPYLYKQGTVVLTLYEIGDYKFVANNVDVGDYTALAIKRDTIKSEEGTIINELEIGLDNTSLEFRTLVMAGGLDDLEVVIKLGFCTANPSTGVVTLHGSLQVFSGIIDEPKGDENWLTVTVRPNNILEREFPRRIFQEGCNWMFCDNFCGLELDDYAVETVLTVESNGTVFTCTHGKGTDYFVPGYVKILDGDYVDQVRPMKSNDSTTVTVRIPFENAIPDGTSVRLQKLCYRNYLACKNTFSNETAFGGYTHCPRQPIL